VARSNFLLFLFSEIVDFKFRQISRLGDGALGRRPLHLVVALLQFRPDFGPNGILKRKPPAGRPDEFGTKNCPKCSPTHF
jgi:hypothetical protein